LENEIFAAPRRAESPKAEARRILKFSLPEISLILGKHQTYFWQRKF